MGDETLSNNVTPFNYITLCIEDIYYRTKFSAFTILMVIDRLTFKYEASDRLATDLYLYSKVVNNYVL